MKEEELVNFRKTNEITFALKDCAAKFGDVVGAERLTASQIAALNTLLRH
jgi:hypothetical protein